MNKPTLFFSHSSKDKELILLIKNKLDKATGGVLDIFMSSDGQSIPFGTNWVHKIEEGLQEAKIMFVFVTENSISSGWIYFEAGYAYSKGIQVIPVGIGIDIGALKAPLNLLQGFNISSEDSLNNFVTIINRTFQYHFDGCFTSNDYAEIVNILPNNAIQIFELETIVRQVECALYAEYTLPNGNKGNYDIKRHFDSMVTYLEENKIQFSRKTYSGSKCDDIVANGVRIKYFEEKKRENRRNEDRIEFLISPYSFYKSFELLKNLLLLSEDRHSHYIRLHLKEPYKYVTAVEDGSSIISNYPEFEFNKEHIGGYVCNNLGLKFYIFEDRYSDGNRTPETLMSIAYNCSEVQPENVLRLVSRLCDMKIIYKN